jgi:hypothetical protein
MRGEGGLQKVVHSLSILFDHRLRRRDLPVVQLTV